MPPSPPPAADDNTLPFGHTHAVLNQVDERLDLDLYQTDLALQEALAREQAHWAMPLLADYGRSIGTPACHAQAHEANHHPPQLHAFDARGRRIDHVAFHPSWHALMARLRGAGLVSLAHRDTRPGRWAAHLAGLYLHGQVEAGTTCPTTMTWAALPLLQREPALWEPLRAGLLSDTYDPSDQAMAHKHALYIGMGMTEKQGGSDLRAVTTQAFALNGGGQGGAYRLRGHKWFMSAPTCDAHLVLARTAQDPPSCFFVPRWRPDGSRNAVHIQRLKDKLGNRSNASAEVEFHDAYAVLLGPPGRGIPTLLEMAHGTRVCCVMGSAALLRQALVQALSYARQRRAFGRPLVEHPLMRAVLTDLALESEAALVLLMRLAHACEHEDDPLEQAIRRILTPAAKYWVCKRAITLTGEAMEVLGGNGYVENGIMARLFREAPVNSIWEGSGNVMCLDVLRAAARQPESLQRLLDELSARAHADAPVRQAVQGLRDAWAHGVDEGRGRWVAEQLVLTMQAGLLRAHAPQAVADAFIRSRLAGMTWGRSAGSWGADEMQARALLARALAD